MLIHFLAILDYQENPNDQLIDDKEFRGPVFQRPFQYLSLLAEKKLSKKIRFDSVVGTAEEMHQMFTKVSPNPYISRTSDQPGMKLPGVVRKYYKSSWFLL